MPTLAEILRAFYVFWRLLRFDQQAVDIYPATRAAMWRSFAVCPLVILMMIAGNWGYHNTEQAVRIGLGPLSFAFYIVTRYVISVAGFYLIMASLTTRLGCRHRLDHYITLQNWISVPILLIGSLVDSYVFNMGIKQESLMLYYLPISVISMLVSWVITIATLRVRHLVGFGMCCLEGLFGQLVIISMMLVISLTFMKP